MAASYGGRGGLLLTVQDTGGDFGLSGSDRAEFGGLAGLAKTAAQEWPNASCKALDVDRGDRSDADVARAIVDELLRGGPEPEVGLRASGERLALRSVPTALSAAGAAIGPDTVVVATGGARGVTAVPDRAGPRPRRPLRAARPHPARRRGPGLRRPRRRRRAQARRAAARRGGR
ncbi:MAG: hypothetical protein R3F59_16215 [Myxococcota bacterium]